MPFRPCPFGRVLLSRRNGITIAGASRLGYNVQHDCTQPGKIQTRHAPGGEGGRALFCHSSRSVMACVWLVSASRIEPVRLSHILNVQSFDAYTESPQRRSEAHAPSHARTHPAMPFAAAAHTRTPVGHTRSSRTASTACGLRMRACVRAGYACVRAGYACVRAGYACVRAGYACVRAGFACVRAGYA